VEAATTWEWDYDKHIATTARSDSARAAASALGITQPRKSEEIRIGYLAPTTGCLRPGRQGHGRRLQDVSRRKEQQARRRRHQVHRRRRAGQAGHRRHQGEEAHPAGQGAFLRRRLAGIDGYALAPGEHGREGRLHLSGIVGDDLTQRDLPKYPYFFRTGWSSSQPSHPFGQWACEQGYKKIAIIAADYAFGYECPAAFQRAFEACGGQIVQKIWPPLTTKDFGPYIPTLRADADAIFTVMVGPMSLQFPKQLAAAGNKRPVIGGGPSYDEFVLPRWATR
jgi:branched-chain amino acid transport system substrate-binding protein